VVTHGPLHRSGRAELPHPAPTLGTDAETLERIRMVFPFPSCCLTYPLERAERVAPALCPERVALGQVPLARPLPSTASVAGPSALFGSFVGTMDPSDFRVRSSSACVIRLPDTVCRLIGDR